MRSNKFTAPCLFLMFLANKETITVDCYVSCIEALKPYNMKATTLEACNELNKILGFVYF